MLTFIDCCFSEEYASYHGFKSKVFEIFESADGSNFTQSCALSYSDLSTAKSTSMMSEISDALARSGCSETVTSVTHLPSFIAADNKVSTVWIQTIL